MRPPTTGSTHSRSPAWATAIAFEPFTLRLRSSPTRLKSAWTSAVRVPEALSERSTSLARFEIAHERGEGVGVLGDLDEALIDIHGMPARRDIAVDAGEPAIGREAEFPGIDGRRLDIGRARAWPEVGAESWTCRSKRQAGEGERRSTKSHSYPSPDAQTQISPRP